jgi:predicted acylesterase/phospholipase RssA
MENFIENEDLYNNYFKEVPNFNDIIIKVMSDISIEEADEDVDEKIDVDENIEVDEAPDKTEAYDTLVLSGASSSAFITLGAVQGAFDNHILKSVKNYIGTSSGAMISYLVCIGYSPIEIMVYICTQGILDKLSNFNILNMVNGLGATEFSYIYEELEKMTIRKIGRLLTLEDLKINYGKTLVCITYNKTKNITEYLSPDTHPKLPCLIALQMSSSLPLIFEKYYYNKECFIDGGLCENFALKYAEKIGNKVLGINLGQISKNEEDLDGAFDLLKEIYDSLLIPINVIVDNNIIYKSEHSKIISIIPSKKTPFFDFSIDSRLRLDMFSEGYRTFCEQI